MAFPFSNDIEPRSDNNEEIVVAASCACSTCAQTLKENSSEVDQKYDIKGIQLFNIY